VLVSDFVLNVMKRTNKRINEFEKKIDAVRNSILCGHEYENISKVCIRVSLIKKYQNY